MEKNPRDFRADDGVDKGLALQLTLRFKRGLLRLFPLLLLSPVDLSLQFVEAELLFLIKPPLPPLTLLLSSELLLLFRRFRFRL